MGAFLSLPILAIAVVLLYVSLHNGLVRKVNRVDQASSSIDVMLKKRYDLIPNLVAAVQQYMEHERSLLEALTDLRTRALSPQATPEDRNQLDVATTAALRQFTVAVENYPQLKASETFLQLQGSLNEVEEQLSASRRFYNAAVTEYHDALRTWPSSIVAGQMGLQPRELFAAVEAERQPVDVGALFDRAK